jgi:hypothetical protein
MEHARNDQLTTTHVAERAALYRRAPFALYGLANAFEGLRALGESATTEEHGRETIEHLGLAHGSQRDDDQPHVDVITATRGGAPDPLEALAAEAGVVMPPEAADASEALARAQGPVRHITRRLVVEGRAVEASGFEAGRCWILQAPVGEQVVTVAGSNYPSEGIALARITNLDEYIEGTRQLLGQGPRPT